MQSNLNSGLLSGLKSTTTLIKNTENKFFGVNLNYSSDGDINGVFYYRGTNNNTTTWTNPTISSRIILNASSINGSISVLVDRLNSNNSAFYTNNNEGEFVTVDLVNYNLICNYYSIQNSDFYFPVNWDFQGSNDNTNWITLDSVIGSTNNTEYGWLSRPITDTTPYRYFRILMNGFDSSGFKYLIFSEFELYGFLNLIS